eukprot:773103-Rhodomonas_salina.6
MFFCALLVTLVLLDPLVEDVGWGAGEHAHAPAHLRAREGAAGQEDGGHRAVREEEPRDAAVQGAALRSSSRAHPGMECNNV